MRPEDRPVSAEEVRALVERLRKTAANVSHRSVVEREAADALAALAAENERLRHELSVERTHNDMIGKQLESFRAGPEPSLYDLAEWVLMYDDTIASGDLNDLDVIRHDMVRCAKKIQRGSTPGERKDGQA